jgi:hypothetical protein
MALKPSLSLLTLGVVLAACGSSGDRDAAGDYPPPAKTAAAKVTPAATASKTVSGPKRSDSDGDGIPDAITVKGALGDKLALAGAGLNDNPSDHTKTQIRVTLMSVAGPFSGYQIASNRKLIGLKLKFSNVGKLRYDDPLPDGTLTLSSGETGKQTNLIPLSGKNPCDDVSLKLKDGQSRTTCIAFEVPKSAKPKTFEYVTDSGYGDTGLWKLH